MIANTHQLNQLKHRFIKDLSAPILVFEDNYWDFAIGLYKEYGDLWNKLVQGIEEEYNGEVQRFLDEFAEVNNKIIDTIKSSEGYKTFITGDYKKFEIKRPEGVGSGDIYKEDRINKWYLTVDLEKANVQSLNFNDPNIFVGKKVDENIGITEIYNEWIANSLLRPSQKLLQWYIPKSKYVRQKTFGNCNPGRQTMVETFMVDKAGRFVAEKLGLQESSMRILSTDEMIFELIGNIKNFEGIEEVRAQVQRELGICVKIETFYLRLIKFRTTNEHDVDVYVRDFGGKKPNAYKGIPGFYYTQIYEILNNIEPDPEGRDLAFYQEKEIAKFVNRLRKI